MLRFDRRLTVGERVTRWSPGDAVRAPSLPERPGGAAPGSPALAAAELHLSGVVQGVGFRPFVHRMALRHGVSGSVRNEAGSVRIVAEAAPEALDAFARSLVEEAPPLARIDRFDRAEAEPTGIRDFRVAASSLAPRGRLPVSPDVALCDACRAEAERAISANGLPVSSGTFALLTCQ